MSLTDRNIAIKNLWYVIRQIQLRLIRKYGYAWFLDLKESSRKTSFAERIEELEELSATQD